MSPSVKPIYSLHSAEVYALPDSIHSLRQVLGLDFGLKLIPAQLQDKMRSEVPDKA
jgi:hypothetical protein